MNEFFFLVDENGRKQQNKKFVRIKNIFIRNAIASIYELTGTSGET